MSQFWGLRNGSHVSLSRLHDTFEFLALLCLGFSLTSLVGPRSSLSTVRLLLLLP